MLIALAQGGDDRAAIDDDGFGRSFSGGPYSLKDSWEANPSE